MLTQSIKKILHFSGIGWITCLRKDGYLVDVGWFRSFKEKRSVDRDGNPIPWIAYPAIDFLRNRVNRQMQVFEFGSGNSTLWWAGKVAEVCTVEHDPKWYSTIKNNMPDNVVLILHGDEKYFNAPLESGKKYDIIVIDGIDRHRCLESSLNSLTPDGVIIWDDSKRMEYQPSFDKLREHGFRRIEFSGPSPIYNNTVETSIFYRDNNCLGI